MKVQVCETNFPEFITSPKLVFLHFWSDFCGPCKVQSRVLDQVEEKYSSKVMLGEVNSQEHLDWTEAFGVQATPTTLVFREGSLLARLTGVHTLSKIEEIISTAGVLK